MARAALLGVILLISAIWVINEVWSKQKKMSTGNKFLWTVFAVLFSVITAVVYYYRKKS